MSNSFEKRTIINGAQLLSYVDKSVSILLRVESLSSYSMTGVSADNKTIEVNLPYNIEVGSGHWVEVIGFPKSATAMTAKEVIMLGGEKDTELDTKSYEMAALFFQHFKNTLG